jgi:hypothetical protein
LNNTDCALYSAGTCTFTERRECFRDPITAFSPATDASHPVITSVFCIPPTTNAAINVAAGYPGPGRAVIQTETFMTCPSDPSVTYTPGVGF